MEMKILTMEIKKGEEKIVYNAKLPVRIAFIVNTKGELHEYRINKITPEQLFGLLNPQKEGGFMEDVAKIALIVFAILTFLVWLIVMFIAFTNGSEVGLTEFVNLVSLNSQTVACLRG